MITLRIVKAPSWLLKGIDLKPFMERAIESLSSEIITRHNRSQKLGARMNPLTRDAQPLLHTITSPLADAGVPIAVNPRRTGAAMLKKSTGRFKGMAPRSVKKYIIEPLKALWAS